MQMPVDIPAVLKAAVDIEAAAATPLAVSVFIDDTAPGDVVGHVRSAFASAGANTRVTISYLGSGLAVPYEEDDMAVIVAGVSERIGEQAAHLRSLGIPVMVATTMPALVDEAASAFGHPIPAGDLVAPARPAAPKASEDADEAALVGTDDAAGADAPGEPIVLDEEAAASLNVRMGEWVIAACRPKKLAFALAFPFVRRPLSTDAVHATAVENAAVGLLPIIPGADMPIMTLNQAKMLLQIAAAYGQPLGVERVKELAAVVGGAFLFRNIARSVAGVVPVVGWAVRAAVGFAGTEAMGRAAIEYFEAGGDIVGFASVVQTARDEAVDAASRAAKTPAGQKAIAGARTAVRTLADSLKKRG